MKTPVNLDNLREMTEGDPILEQALFEEFIRSAEACIAIMNAHCDHGSQEEWRKQAHALKGIAANLGAEQLATAGMKAQELFTGSFADKQVALECVQKEYAEVKSFLLQCMPQKKQAEG